MKRLLLLIVLFSQFGFSQAEPGGQYMFTEKYRVKIAAAIAGEDANVFQDHGFLLQEANEFMLNPSNERYDYLTSGTIPTSDPEGLCNTPALYSDPGGTCPNNFVSNNIFSAAIVAWATDNTAMAQQVVLQILARAEDTNLDFSNTSRFNPDWLGGDTGRPYVFIASWTKKMLDAYTLIHSRNLYTINATQQNTIDQWFLDAANFYGPMLDSIMDAHWGSGWQTDNFTLSVPRSNYVLASSNGSSTFTNPGFGNSSGTPNAAYTATQLQQTTLNNTRWEFADYAGAYGLAYNHASYKKLTHDFFKMFVRFSVYPDNTPSEIFRTRSGTGSTEVIRRKENLGVTHYPWITLQSVILTAHSHKVAKVNGLPGMENETGNEYYDYSTSIGTSDIASLSTYTGSSTSGGPKNIENMMIATLKFVQQNYGSTYGWNPVRYVPFGAFNALGLEDDKRPWVHVMMIANGYLNSSYLKSVINQEPGFDLPAVKNDANGVFTNGSAQSKQGAWGKTYASDDVWANTEGFLLENSEFQKARARSNNIILTF